MEASPFYKGKDPRNLPTYSVPESAHYLSIPAATLRSWVHGRDYPTRLGKKRFQPVVEVPADPLVLLSFVNLIEAHVLDAIRRHHQIRLDKIRIAIDYLQQKFGSAHPLAEYRFETNGLDLFVDKYEQLLNVSRGGQVTVRELLQIHLNRIEWDSKGFASRLYPFTRKRVPDEPKAVVIDSRISFGLPTLVGTGIRTAIVAERYKAGESIDDLVRDYGRSSLEIQEAIRCELQVEAA